jgi:hypothetical protein
MYHGTSRSLMFNSGAGNCNDEVDSTSADEDSPAQTFLRKLISAAVDKGTLPQSLEELGVCNNEGVARRSVLMASSFIHSKPDTVLADLLKTFLNSSASDTGH